MRLKLNLIYFLSIVSILFGCGNRNKTTTDQYSGIQKDSLDCLLLETKVFLLFEQEEYGLAKVEMIKAIEEGKTCPQMNMYYGIALQRGYKDYEGSLKYFDLAIKHNPNHYKNYFLKGVSLLELKRYEESIELFNQSLIQKDDYYQTYYNKGVAFMKLYRVDSSIVNYLKSIELDSTYASNYVNLGYVLHNIKQYDEAIFYHTKAIQLDSTNLNPYKNRALSYFRSDQIEKGCTDYYKAISMGAKFSSEWDSTCIKQTK